MTVNEILQRAQTKMNETVEHTRKELTALRTGRASLAIMDGIAVEYYGTPTPLNQVATLTIPDPTLIVAALGSVGPFGDREGDPEGGPRAQPLQRRQGDPDSDPSAHGGAAQGDGEE